TPLRVWHLRMVCRRYQMVWFFSRNTKLADGVSAAIGGNQPRGKDFGFQFYYDRASSYATRDGSGFEQSKRPPTGYDQPSTWNRRSSCLTTFNLMDAKCRVCGWRCAHKTGRHTWLSWESGLT